MFKLNLVSFIKVKKKKNLKNLKQLTSVWAVEAGVKVLVLPVLQASPVLEVSAEEETVAIEVNDSDEGSEALSEYAESVSVTSSPLSGSRDVSSECIPKKSSLVLKPRPLVISAARASSSA